MAIRPIVAWYDMWVGAFWDKPKRRLYLFPIPCIGLMIQFRRMPEALASSSQPSAQTEPRSQA